MKKISTLPVLALAIAISVISCKKGNQPVKPNYGRTVKFKLYTNEDFSDDEHNITFSIFIKDGERHLFDSTYATIKVKDIPNAAHAIIAEKKVYNDDSQLTVGFIYEIEDVGVSWHIDTLAAGTPGKLVDYAFR